MNYQNTRRSSNKAWYLRVRTYVIAVIVLILLFTIPRFFAQVPTGHTGLLVKFGAVSERILPSGLSLKDFFSNVVNIDNRECLIPLSLASFTKDLQEITVDLAVKFQIPSAASRYLYSNNGPEWYNILLLPRIYELSKNAITPFKADEVSEGRDKISDIIRNRLSEEMEPYGILIKEVSISNISFDPEYTQAIKEKQIASQKQLQADIDKQTRQTNADAAYYENQKQTDAAAYKITKEAEAQAAANIEIAKSLTSALIDYYKVEKWNGTVPSVQLGDGTTTYPVINLQ